MTQRKRPTKKRIRTTEITARIPTTILRDLKETAKAIGLDTRKPDPAIREAIKLFLAQYSAKHSLADEPLEIAKPFSEMYTEWKDGNGLSHAAASEVLGVNKRTLENWGAGRSTPTLGIQRIMIGFMNRYRPDETN